MITKILLVIIGIEGGRISCFFSHLMLDVQSSPPSLKKSDLKNLTFFFAYTFDLSGWV